MGQRLVTITENPCKMCFPLGVVTAFYGVAKAMSILHGSQGCSTYIRRHMATHYNEPIDIASSSLSEEGTVFGGEKNLLKGLSNLIKLYDPELIGVSTTCLAETIGEDLQGTLAKFRDGVPGLKAKLIPINAPGYGGTHYEGYWRGLRSILSSLGLDYTPHGGLNVIVGPASPADVRYLKDLLGLTGLRHTLFPDISDNLDGAFNPVYSRLPQKGVPVSKIAKMAGASITIELSALAPPEESPGLYLEKNYGVRLLRLAPPVGLVATDAFLSALSGLGAKFPDRVFEERGRLMDAMADSHKHSALGRAAIFGDPDFVLSMSRLCAENGLLTMLATTGSKSPAFKAAIKGALLASSGAVAAPEPLALDSADFSLIESESRRLGVNLLIGSSEGRRLAQKERLPLVRCAFPVHDHVGGQRVRTMGYQGATITLDRLVNKLISQEEESFRELLTTRHHRPAVVAAETLPMAVTLMPAPLTLPDTALPKPYAPITRGTKAVKAKDWNNTSPSTSAPDLAPWGLSSPKTRIAQNQTDEHPCFSLTAARDHARLHLPVSPGCNVSCNYCRRDLDCPNESRPGVTSALLSPEEALERFREAKRRLPSLKVVGFAGPGESLFREDLLFRTLELVRQEDSLVTLCLSTNGLALPFHL
ncbi:MAG: radical SAM protein, partial [Deltaproteobacteria bacterium]|nr:radical SAM protein [Deltaproteobacteria bacterium]